MSHEATKWALKQRGLKPATKIVLFYLADHFNPDGGCFPEHATIAEEAEISERSVRDQLDILEARGLIRRVPGGRVKGGRQAGTFASTRYILALDKTLDPDNQRQDLPTAEFANGEIVSPPTAEFAAHRRQNLPTNPVIESCKRTGKYKVQPADEVSEILIDFAPAEAVASFVAYRKKHKAKGLTVTAAKRLGKNLAAIIQSGGNAADALGLAEERGWATVEPSWYQQAVGKAATIAGQQPGRPKRSREERADDSTFYREAAAEFTGLVREYQVLFDDPCSPVRNGGLDERQVLQEFCAAALKSWKAGAPQTAIFDGARSEIARLVREGEWPTGARQEAPVAQSLRAMADWINDPRRSIPQSVASSVDRAALLAHGLVTAERLRERLG